ncbi:VWA domain-containing protein [Granulicella sp. dw_53]|uniref:VWA domain-containing protein n=1 Tax=Granulicella sp. dw_53 TaxID=2719792 RepID=UPI001BD69074|nr:VWA domain-containing protein [Granulicella sp. dw_53]
MRLRLSAALCLALPVSTLAQTPAPPTLRTGAQLVIVDVTVTDSRGNPIHDLKQSDFSLQESGAPQTISHFDEHSAPTAADLAKSPPMPPAEPNIYTNFTFTPENAPIDILLIDNLNTPADKQANTQQQLLAFQKSMKPSTRLAVFSLTTHLSLLQGLTSDPQLLLAAFNKRENTFSSSVLPDAIGAEPMSDNLRGSPWVASGMRRNEVEQVRDQNSNRIQYTLAAMNQLARYLSGMPGRKNLIWLSGSFPLSFAFATTGSFQTKFRDTMNLLARSQVAVYPVDLRGLTNTPLSDVSATRYIYNRATALGDADNFNTLTRDEHSTMGRMAAATGGQVYTNINDIGHAVDKILDHGSNYYTLAYIPTTKGDTGSFRKIEVYLASGDYALAYRDGYYVEPSGSQPKSKPSQATTTTPNSLDTMRTAMQRGAPTPTQIIFKALLIASPTPSARLAEGNTASPKSKPPYRLITIAYAVNPGDITMPTRPDTTREVALQFVTLAYDRDGQLFTQQSNPVNVFVKPQGYQQFLKEGIRYQQQIAVPAKGEYYLRVGIHDLIGDKVGAIEVPAALIATAPPQSASTK